MKITYIVGTFPKLSETFILQQITGLIDAGIEVDIISATRSGEEKVHENIIKYNLLAKTQFLTRNSTSLGFELNEKLLTSLIFTDIIHAHFAALPTDFALKISRMLNIPFIFTAHAYDIFISPDINRLKEKVLNASRVITISDYNKKYLTNLLGNDIQQNIEIVRCGINLEKFKYIDRSDRTTKIFLFVGRLTEKKGLPYAIEAFSIVNKDFPDSEFRIIGGGDLEDDIKRLVNKLDLERKVIFLGAQPQTVVQEEMKNADIFVLTSVTAQNGDKEGIPIVLMEAQAMGLPVISTLHSGIPEVVIDRKTGYLVPEKDIKAIVDKMRKLLSDVNLRKKMGIEGNKFICKNYDHRLEMSKMLNILGDLSKGREILSEISRDKRMVLEERIRNLTVQLIEYRGDQLKKIEQSILKYDDKLKQIDEVAKLLINIKQKDDLLKNKDDQIRQKDNYLKQKDETIKQKDDQIRQKDDYLKQKDETIRNKDDQIRQKDEIVRQKDLQAIQFQSDLKQKDLMILEYNKNLKITEDKLKNLEEKLAENMLLVKKQQEEIFRIDGILKTKDAIIQEREKVILEKDKQISEKVEKIKLLEGDIKKKNDELIILRKWLGDITASIPYKIFKKFLKPIRDWLKNKKKESKKCEKKNLIYSDKRNILVFLPDWSKANPYQKLLYENLSKNGLKLIGIEGNKFTIKWIIINSRFVKVFHLHWLNGIFDPNGKGLNIIKTFIFIFKIILTKLFGYDIIWTVHNFVSHESNNYSLEIKINKLVAILSRIIIVHCHYASDIICNKLNLKNNKVHVIPHGSYIGYYKNNISRENARRKLGINQNDFVFLFFGMIRHYKGLETLIFNFKLLKNHYENISLLIVGRPHNKIISRHIEEITNDSKIYSFLKFIPDDEVQYFFNASDVVVLPYKNILTSGAALLSLSFGKKIIVPNFGCIPELIKNINGYIYYSEDELIRTMEKAIKEYKEGNEKEIIESIKDLNWEKIVRDKYLPLFNFIKI